MRKLFLLLMAVLACTWSLTASARTVTGSVLDAANNEPLIGATIMPIGGGQGTAADIDGNFTLNIPDNVKQVTVSYVGYKTKTVAVTNPLRVYLESTSTNLDDVVVIAYGTGTKESLTGSVAVVDSKQIEDRPVTSVTSALEGNAPGVQVNNSTGTPGSSPSIRIRGFNSFTSAQSPLYVVDGVVYDGSISDLNPNDIESMSILKDAASCALYGNRGANGVILINTKRAKGQGKVDVTLQVRQGMYNRGLPFYDTLDANQWMETCLNAWANGGVSQKSYNDYASALAALSPNFVNTFLLGQNIYDKPGNQLFDPATGKLLGNVLPGYNDLDWWDAISRSGYRQEYNVNAAGATEKFNVFASVGYLKEQGYMLQTDFERFTGRVAADFTPVSFLKIGTNIAASYQDSEDGSADADNLNATTNPFLTNFYAPVRPYYQHNEDGSVMIGDDGKPVWNTLGLNKGDNVAWVMRLNRSDWTTINVNGSLYGTVILPYGFEATVRGNMLRSKVNGLEYSNDKIGAQKGAGGLDLSGQSVNSHTFMQTLTWNHDYGLSNIDVLLDHENYEYSYDTNFLRKSGQLLPNNYYASNFENMDYSSQSIGKMRTESYLGRVRYNYDQKYFGEFSIRRDGTSRFAKNNRWGTFWSVGGSWIITKEKFMQNLEWLNYLKLRAAYGAVGNDAAASIYSYYNTFFQTTYGTFGALVPYDLASTDLRWESTKTLDIALEGSLFNDRFTFSVGYFDKRNADLLYNVTLPSSAGTAGGPGSFGANLSVMQNIGTMSNRGWELQFGVDIIRSAEFNWHFDIDASFVKNKIVKLPYGHSMPAQGLFYNKSIYQHYTYEWAGIDTQTGNSLYYMAPDSPDLWVWDDNGHRDTKQEQQTWDNTVAAAKGSGHYFEDENGNPLTDRTEYAYRRDMGTAIPTVYGSFGTQLSWKGINLGLLFTYSLGGKTYNSNYASLMNFGTNEAGALHKDILNAWTGTPAVRPFEDVSEKQDGSSKIYLINSSEIDPNGVPINDTNLSQYNSASSSRFLISNNYLCLKNLNISYDFPAKWVNPMKLKGLNLGFSVDNLFIITRQKGLNPQYGFGGGQGAYYVPSRVFSFQLTAKF